MNTIDNLETVLFARLIEFWGFVSPEKKRSVLTLRISLTGGDMELSLARDTFPKGFTIHGVAVATIGDDSCYFVSVNTAQGVVDRCRVIASHVAFHATTGGYKSHQSSFSFRERTSLGLPALAIISPILDDIFEKMECDLKFEYARQEPSQSSSIVCLVIAPHSVAMNYMMVGNTKVVTPLLDLTPWGLEPSYARLEIGGCVMSYGNSEVVTMYLGNNMLPPREAAKRAVGVIKNLLCE